MAKKPADTEPTSVEDVLTDDDREQIDDARREAEEREDATGDDEVEKD